jgi:hypothetical protein|nr:hypothetical protein [Candidatus Krumholzibacteria bacterium]
MRKLTPLYVTVLAMFTVLVGTAPVSAGEFVGGINLGAEAGFGGHVHGTFRNFTQDLPLSARFTAGYHKASAGDPFAARRVFINNNTNGTPEDSAKYLQARFDLVFPVFKVGPQQIFLFGGPRVAKYSAEFVYVGGNEDFEVKTSPWGIGMGLETAFAVNDRTDFLIQVGLDHFSKSDLEGHDTIYTADGDYINPREDYTWDSANDAVDQPETEVLVMVGMQIKL